MWRFQKSTTLMVHFYIFVLQIKGDRALPYLVTLLVLEYKIIVIHNIAAYVGKWTWILLQHIMPESSLSDSSQSGWDAHSLDCSVELCYYRGLRPKRMLEGRLAKGIIFLAMSGLRQGKEINYLNG